MNREFWTFWLLVMAWPCLVVPVLAGIWLEDSRWNWAGIMLFILVLGIRAILIPWKEKKGR